MERKTNFAIFGIWHFVMSPLGGNLRKLKTGTELQTLAYRTVSTSFLYSNAFMAKSGAQGVAFTSVTDKQTKTHRFWPPQRRV